MICSQTQSIKLEESSRKTVKRLSRLVSKNWKYQTVIIMTIFIINNESNHLYNYGNVAHIQAHN